MKNEKELDQAIDRFLNAKQQSIKETFKSLLSTVDKMGFKTEGGKQEMRDYFLSEQFTNNFFENQLGSDNPEESIQDSRLIAEMNEKIVQINLKESLNNN